MIPRDNMDDVSEVRGSREMVMIKSGGESECWVPVYGVFVWF